MGALNENKKATEKSISYALEMAINFIDNGFYKEARSTLLAIERNYGENKLNK